MIAGHLPELVLVLILALVFFGPKRLPEVGSAVGQTIRDFKRGMSHLSDDVPDETSHLVADAHHVEPEVVVVDVHDRPVA